MLAPHGTFPDPLRDERDLLRLEAVGVFVDRWHAVVEIGGGETPDHFRGAGVAGNENAFAGLALAEGVLAIDE